MGTIVAIGNNRYSGPAYLAPLSTLRAAAVAVKSATENLERLSVS